jgi:hypothetical protein
LWEIYQFIALGICLKNDSESQRLPFE